MKYYYFAFFLLASTQTIFAQDMTSVRVAPEEVPTIRRNTIEVKPLSILMSSIPGVAAGGASYEAYLTRQWAAVVDGNYGDIRLSDKIIDRAQDDGNTLVPKKGHGYSVGGGLRYYEDPIGDSLYGGMNIHYSESKYTWRYDDNEIESEQYAVIPSLDVGYRWVWRNGVLVRLGAGAGLLRADARNTRIKVAANDKAQKGQDKVDDTLDQSVVPRLDVGLGYNF